MADNVIVCRRRMDLENSAILGSSLTVCEKCGTEVWISPASKQRRDDLKAVVACTSCAEHMMAHDKDARVAEPTPEQKAELLRVWLSVPEKKI